MTSLYVENMALTTVTCLVAWTGILGVSFGGVVTVVGYRGCRSYPACRSELSGLLRSLGVVRVVEVIGVVRVVEVIGVVRLFFMFGA